MVSYHWPEYAVTFSLIGVLAVWDWRHYNKHRRQR